MPYKSPEARRQAYLAKREYYLELNKKRYKNKKEELLEYQREYRKKNKELVKEKTRNKRASRQLEAIKLLGGKCQRCNQEFDPVCYDFHHIDPSQKDVTIGENMLISKERFFNEVRKCLLLCANCHRLTHKELRNNEN